MVIDSAFSLVRRCALAKLHQFQNICCFYDPGDALVTLVTLVTLLTSRDTSDTSDLAVSTSARQTLVTSGSCDFGGLVDP